MKKKKICIHQRLQVNQKRFVVVVDDDDNDYLSQGLSGLDVVYISADERFQMC